MSDNTCTIKTFERSLDYRGRYFSQSHQCPLCRKFCVDSVINSSRIKKNIKHGIASR